MKPRQRSMAMLVSSMVIFGTVGIFRRAIPLPSAVIAMFRGGVGALFLLLLMLIRREKPDRAAIRENLVRLILSGAANGVNWILLFEAYRYTSVATATLCYYMAPVLVILLSIPLLGERLTVRKLLCVGVALTGMVLVSGVIETGFSGAAELKGILLGLGAAVLYATLILINKRMTPIAALDRTIVQLASAAAVVLIFLALTGGLSGLSVPPRGFWLLLVLCVVHTGLAYALYFGSVEQLPATVLALFSYIDPVVAVLLSALLLREELTVSAGLGAVLILGGAALMDSGKKA